MSWGYKISSVEVYRMFYITLYAPSMVSNGGETSHTTLNSPYTLTFDMNTPSDSSFNQVTQAGIFTKLYANYCIIGPMSVSAYKTTEQPTTTTYTKITVDITCEVEIENSSVNAFLYDSFNFTSLNYNYISYLHTK